MDKVLLEKLVKEYKITKDNKIFNKIYEILTPFVTKKVDYIYGNIIN
jgi:hypothetical protein